MTAARAGEGRGPTGRENPSPFAFRLSDRGDSSGPPTRRVRPLVLLSILGAALLVIAAMDLLGPDSRIRSLFGADPTVTPLDQAIEGLRWNRPERPPRRP